MGANLMNELCFCTILQIRSPHEIHVRMICLIDEIVEMLCLFPKELCTEIITPLRQLLQIWQHCIL